MLWNRLATPQDTHDQKSNAPSAPLAKCTRFGCAWDWEDKQQWLVGEAPSATARFYSSSALGLVVRGIEKTNNNDWLVNPRAQLLGFTQAVGIVTAFLSLARVGLPRLWAVLPSPYTLKICLLASDSIKASETPDVTDFVAQTELLTKVV